MRLINKEEAEQIFSEARAWFDKEEMFSQFSPACLLVAVEFALNRGNVTLYPYKAEQND